MIAIGGMKNPRVSLHRVPCHREVGTQVRKIIDQYLERNPEVQIDIMRSVGDTTKQYKGPANHHVQQVRAQIEEYLKVSTKDLPMRGDGQRMTELYQGIFEAWVAISEDPDHHVPVWLKEGTPTGIEQNPVDAGIFPRVDQGVDEKDRRPLVFGGETFLNYKSFEESEEAPNLLSELVEAGYVQEFADEAGARTSAGGKPLVTSNYICPHSTG